jgi:hypothetical protein
MYIIATILSILGVLITTLTNIFDKNKRTKNIIIYTGMIISVIGILWGNNQKRKEDNLSNKRLNEQICNIFSLQNSLNNASDSIYKINSTLRSEKNKNDSLKIVMSTINKQNDKLIKQSTQIQEEEVEHFIKTQLALQDVSVRFGYRHINQITEELLTNELKNTKGNLNIMASDAGQEGNAFCNQLIRIFEKANWKVNRSKGIMSTGVTEGILIGIDEKDSVLIKPAISLYYIMNMLGYKTVLTKNRLLGNSLINKGSKKLEALSLDIIIFPYTAAKTE